jgi:hypothetical protein
MEWFMSLEEMTHDELIAKATELGADVRKSWSKDRIAAAIVEKEQADAAEGEPPTPSEAPAEESVEAPEPEASAEDAPADEDEGLVSARERARAVGILVPDSWTQEEILSAVEAYEAPVEEPYEPHSPRG